MDEPQPQGWDGYCPNKGGFIHKSRAQSGMAMAIGYAAWCDQCMCIHAKGEWSRARWGSNWNRVADMASGYALRNEEVYGEINEAQGSVRFTEAVKVLLGALGEDMLVSTDELQRMLDASERRGQ